MRAAESGAGAVAGLFEIVEVGVGRGMAEEAAHGDDLTFVMEGVGEDVVEDEGWSTDGDVSVGEVQGCGCVELQVGEG